MELKILGSVSPNSYLDKNSIRKTKGIFTPKILLFLADELNELNQ